MLNKKYDLFLIPNNDTDMLVAYNQNFDYTVKHYSYRKNFSQVITLNKGYNNIAIYAKISNGDITFNYITISCLQFVKYKEFDDLLET